MHLIAPAHCGTLIIISGLRWDSNNHLSPLTVYLLTRLGEEREGRRRRKEWEGELKGGEVKGGEVKGGDEMRWEERRGNGRRGEEEW